MELLVEHLDQLIIIYNGTYSSWWGFKQPDLYKEKDPPGKLLTNPPDELTVNVTLKDNTNVELYYKLRDFLFRYDASSPILQNAPSEHKQRKILGVKKEFQQSPDDKKMNALNKLLQMMCMRESWTDEEYEIIKEYFEVEEKTIVHGYFLLKLKKENELYNFIIQKVILKPTKKID